MTQITFEGYYTENICKALIEELEGGTFQKFHLEYSNCAGNCTLIVSTDYPTTKRGLFNDFVYFALNALAMRVRGSSIKCQ